MTRKKDKLLGCVILLIVIGILLWGGYGCSSLLAEGEIELQQLEQLHQSLIEHGVITEGVLIECWSENYKPRSSLLTYKFIVETKDVKGQTILQEYITKKIIDIPSLCNPASQERLAKSNRIRYLPEDPNQNELLDVDLIGPKKAQLSLNPYVRIGWWSVMGCLMGLAVLIYGILVSEK